MIMNANLEIEYDEEHGSQHEMRIDEDIDNIMTFNSNPTDEEKKNFVAIAEGDKVFAQIIRNNSPKCARQTIALQHVVDARMSANAAVATRGANFAR